MWARADLARQEPSPCPRAWSHEWGRAIRAAIIVLEPPQLHIAAHNDKAKAPAKPGLRWRDFTFKHAHWHDLTSKHAH